MGKTCPPTDTYRHSRSGRLFRVRQGGEGPVGAASPSSDPRGGGQNTSGPPAAQQPSVPGWSPPPEVGPGPHRPLAAAWRGSGAGSLRAGSPWRRASEAAVERRGPGRPSPAPGRSSLRWRRPLRRIPQLFLAGANVPGNRKGPGGASQTPTTSRPFQVGSAQLRTTPRSGRRGPRPAGAGGTAGRAWAAGPPPG